MVSPQPILEMCVAPFCMRHSPQLESFLVATQAGATPSTSNLTELSTSFLMVENYPRSPTAVRRRAAGDYSGGSHSSYAANTLEVEPILASSRHTHYTDEAPGCVV